MVLLLVLFAGIQFWFITGFQGLLPPTDDIVRKLNEVMATPAASGRVYGRTFYATVATLSACVGLGLLWWFFDAIRSVRPQRLQVVAIVAAFSAVAYVGGRSGDYVSAARQLDPLFIGLLALGMVYSVALTLDMALALWGVARATETASLNATYQRRLASGRWSAVKKLLDLPRTPLKSSRALLSYGLEFGGALMLVTSFSVVVTMGGIDSKLDGILAACKVEGPRACLAVSALAGRQVLLWFVLALIGMQVGGLMKATAKTLGGLSVPDAIGFAGGRFILYLRPFFVDRVVVPKPRLPFFSRFLTLRPFPLRLEDELFDVADGFLPLVAIGDPKGERLAGRGQAHREFLADADWQMVVLDRLRKAEHVVVVIQETEGVAWELTQIIDGGFAGKTLFLFDPAARDPAVWARLAALIATRFARAGLVAKTFAFAGRPLGLFFQDGQLVEIHNDNWSATSYRTAFSWFLMQRVELNPPARVSTVEPATVRIRRQPSMPDNAPPLVHAFGYGSDGQVDVTSFCRRLRHYWNALRVMVAPMVIGAIGYLIYGIAFVFGDESKRAMILPALQAFKLVPLFLLHAVASIWCWLLIERYPRIFRALLIGALAQASVIGALYQAGIFGVVAEFLSGRRAGSAIEAQMVSLVFIVAIPLVCLMIAAGYLTYDRMLDRRIPSKLRIKDGLSQFHSLVRTRGRSYRKFAFSKIPLVLVAYLGLMATFSILATLGNYVFEHLLPVPLDFSSPLNAHKILKNYTLLAGVRMLVEVFMLLLIVFAVVFWFRMASRSIRRKATDILKDPNYRPIVFLRSFRDENARVAAKNPWWSLLRRRVRLEEVVAGQLMRLGPCVAIGVPGEWAPKLGAMRAYFADADWQAAIRSWTERAVLSVMMAGDSPSVLWELEHLIWSNRVSKLLLILPPDATTEARTKRWQAVSKAFAGTRWQQGVARADVATALCVTFDHDGTVCSVNGWPRHQIDYDVAVQTAVVRLLAPRASAVHAV